MSFGSGSFSQAGYSDPSGDSPSVNLIASLGVVTQYGAMVSPIICPFAGLAPTVIGTFEGAAEFVPRVVSGSFSGLASTQIGDFLSAPGHAIIGAAPFAKPGVFRGSSGAFGGVFAGISVSTIGEFSGGRANQYKFAGPRSTAFGALYRPVTGQFVGVASTRYGDIEGLPHDFVGYFVGYDTIHVLRKPSNLTVFRSL